MKTTQCERCRQRDATVHVTFIASSFEIGTYHFCEPCYAQAQEERNARYEEEIGARPPPAADAPAEEDEKAA